MNKEISLLGKFIDVIIDRRIHSMHPEHGFKNETNYGYLPNTKAGDGEENDGYIFGVNEPLDRFNGIVKAIIIKLEDIE